MPRKRAATSTDKPAPDNQVTIKVLTGCSGKGWAAAKGLYTCSPKLAKLLIDRGYAEPCSPTA